jgi:hypothetical protein
MQPYKLKYLFYLRVICVICGQFQADAGSCIMLAEGREPEVLLRRVLAQPIQLTLKSIFL